MVHVSRAVFSCILVLQIVYVFWDAGNGFIG